MTCTKCQDSGLVIVLANGYADPIFSDLHTRTALPHYGNMPLAVDCECHYNHPISNDQVVETVMGWLEKYDNHIYPMD